MKKTLLTGLACGMFVFGMTGAANANMIENGSFEDPVTSDWYVYQQVGEWWSSEGNTTGIEIQRNGAVSGVVFTQYGNQYVELDSDKDTERGGAYGAEFTNSTMAQLIDTDSGHNYDVSFFYMNRPGTSYDSHGIEVYWNGVLKYFIGDYSNDDYDYRLDDPTSPLASNSIDTYGKDDYFSIWHEFTFSVTGDGSGYSGYDLLSFSAIGLDDSYGGFIDNVTMTPVPEPATMLLLGTGLAGLVGLQRRRKSSRG